MPQLTYSVFSVFMYMYTCVCVIGIIPIYYFILSIVRLDDTGYDDTGYVWII